MIKTIIEKSILLDLSVENDIKQPSLIKAWLFYKVLYVIES